LFEDPFFRVGLILAHFLRERKILLTISSTARGLPLMMIAMLAVGNAQQGPPVGLPVPLLGAGPFVFDTAEKQKIVPPDNPFANRAGCSTRGPTSPRR